MTITIKKINHALLNANWDKVKELVALLPDAVSTDESRDFQTQALALGGKDIGTLEKLVAYEVITIENALYITVNL